VEPLEKIRSAAANLLSIDDVKESPSMKSSGRKFSRSGEIAARVIEKKNQ
jgi:hypothetical protein